MLKTPTVNRIYRQIIGEIRGSYTPNEWTVSTDDLTAVTQEICLSAIAGKRFVRSWPEGYPTILMVDPLEVRGPLDGIMVAGIPLHVKHRSDTALITKTDG